MMKRLIRVAGVLLAGGGLLATAACGGSSGKQSDGKATVTLMTWESAATNKAIDQALTGFHDPNITVKRIDTPNGNYSDKLAALTQAKKLPDLFWCGNDTEQQYTGQGLLTDWASRLSGAGDFGASSFVSSTMKNWKTADGKIGGVPSLINTYGIWYDIDAFKAAGIAVPAAGWTWDQMFDAAAKLHAKGAKYGLVADAMTSTDGPFSLSTYSLSAGGAPFADSVHQPTKTTIDATYTEGVRKLVAGIKSGAIAPPGYDISNQQALFAAGQIPMLWSGQWLAAGFLTDKPKIKYGFAPLPQVNKPATLYDAVGICTPSYTQNADATYKVLKYLDSTVWTKVLPGSPVAAPAYLSAQSAYFGALDKAGLTTVASTVKAGLNTSSTIGVRFTTQWASQSNDLITAYWPDILNGKKPLSDLRTMTDKINEVIKSNS
ncbi:extracellular solute-binding protein [Streptomyces sp. NBC_01340]|uniref:ABC transporter substrate-binding protein n=1 Tax=unclassified Streptomyces TaxID=2593676 RepID=UPI002256AA19|nr:MULTISPECIES: extracellular solute-binding protein [unclassified Streptomyces]MCX4457916.1 extracellular solute-binding protein [Streptomyces sp. NBC_01719]MCX4497273.1 extracellular solute-binding protein [Streptomyces sp. NBC_01728]WSI42128.1 extracellular solute-binding protein [Streptomyces sp. NBC_01340]